MGIGDWGLGIGPNPQSPIPPIPNFKEKKYIVISHENYNLIKSLLSKNIKIAEENLSLLDNSKEVINILKKVNEFKTKLLELLEIIEKMQSNQIILEKHMANSIQLQKKNTDMFVKLKQAEKHFKILVEFAMQEIKVMSVLTVRDYFKETIANISNT